MDNRKVTDNSIKSFNRASMFTSMLSKTCTFSTLLIFVTLWISIPLRTFFSKDRRRDEQNHRDRHGQAEEVLEARRAVDQSPGIVTSTQPVPHAAQPDARVTSDVK